MYGLRFALLLLTWCAFSGLYDAYHLTLGVLASAWVAAVSTHISLGQAGPGRPWERMVIGWKVAGYFGWLVGEVFRANVQVLKLSFASSVHDRVTPEIVEFRTALEDDFSRFLLAHSITLTPGTVTIRIDGDRFLVHALTAEMAADVPGEMERRLLKIFGNEGDGEHD